jgi:hypothetical protein
LLFLENTAATAFALFLKRIFRTWSPKSKRCQLHESHLLIIRQVPPRRGNGHEPFHLIHPSREKPSEDWLLTAELERDPELEITALRKISKEVNLLIVKKKPPPKKMTYRQTLLSNPKNAKIILPLSALANDMLANHMDTGLTATSERLWLRSKE